MLKSRPSLKSKIVSLARLQSVLRKQKNKNVVFTNGVFDIVHAGHVTYLERARALGDILIVALNSDASTSRLKGPTRPVNPLKDRMTVMAALGSIDYVVSFSEDTPIKLIQKLLPDVLVKGGDYDAKKIVGHDDVVQNGGKVKVLRFLKGRSTTAIATKIKSP